MRKFFDERPAVFFWSSMAMVSFLSLFLLFINYQIIMINVAVATDLVDEPVRRSAVVKTTSENTYISCDCEKRFATEVPVSWEGRVMATFLSGGGLGVEKYDKESGRNQFYVHVPDEYIQDFGDRVKVSGRLIGITCAYANTVFGECVGEVVADEIEVSRVQ